MASRVQIPFSFNYSVGGVLTAAVAIPVAVYNRNSDGSQGSPTNVYQAQSGSTLYASMQTDSLGNVPGWVAEGTYKIVASSSGSFGGGTVNFDALYGGGTAMVAAGAIGNAQLQLNSVSTTQLAAAVSQALAPPGTHYKFAGSTLPAGFLWCDGTSYSTSTYPNLFNAIGYVHGGSGGSFNVPDMRGRVLIGAGSGTGLTTRNLAATGGEENHTLITGELPVHGHNAPVSDPTHAHGTSDPGHGHGLTNVNLAGAGWVTGWTNGGISYAGMVDVTVLHSGYTDFINNPWYASDGNHGHGINVGGTGIGIYGAGTGISVSTGNTGSGSSHNNMQPFLVANHIIKY